MKVNKYNKCSGGGGGSYDEGYAQGKTDGVNEQKSKLETINITENGTYSKEDGYNHIEVNVTDLNGSYDEGYKQGQADVAANARVLEVTKNGNYLSKFSDPIIPPKFVTGVYADGTEFHNYAELNGAVYNTKIKATKDSRLEFWFKGKNITTENRHDIIISATGEEIVKISYYGNNNTIIIFFGSGGLPISNWANTVWNHLIISKTEGFWINGEHIDYSSNSEVFGGEFFINGDSNNTNNANGYFGMIKIDDTIIIPTADGFLNTNTGELLEVVKDGAYTYTENLPIYGEGELYKTINVDVKINIQKTGLKFGYSTFNEVPDWVDFEGITDMENMFYNCGIKTIPFLDTSKVLKANGMFQNCRILKTLPNNFNFGNCTNLSDMFNSAGLTDYSFLETWVINPNASMDNMITNTNTTYVPAIPCVGNASFYQSAILWAYSNYSNLTYFGGWIGRKYNITQDYTLKKMPNLTYESCISILNNLYDFTGNGETPDGSQGQLKVHQNFLDKVGNEISIGTNKGWTITV